MLIKATIVAVLVVILSELSESKIMDKCEVARALWQKGVPDWEVPTWVCIANAESRFDTYAVNRNTWDYGIFQISSLWWCQSGDTPGKGCNLSCNSLLHDDISTDIDCVRKVYAETEAMGQRPGFKAWTTWQPHCSGDNWHWVQGC
ncbi:unnamed protein product [Ceutorhynchus assimilis]|uniref:lysozyme n=1 Tax=Ceutorhynchus assimilis TaxID=467358 RepID=A0A9N9QJX8_9CUCU|nr:unnamed protein product [Ceutorhynchus assimilis]